jgi:hypothetical protein
MLSNREIIEALNSTRHRILFDWSDRLSSPKNE